MKRHEAPIPFGLLFEEIAPEPQGLVAPIYDEEMNLSYVQDSQGNRVPYVEFVQSVGTRTETRVRHETTDADPGDDRPGIAITGTRTVTEVRRESTDTDPEDDNARFFGWLGTETLTLVQREPTDTDPEDDHGYSSVSRTLLGTDTVTKVEKEPTDRD